MPEVTGRGAVGSLDLYKETESQENGVRVGDISKQAARGLRMRQRS